MTQGWNRRRKTIDLDLVPLHNPVGTKSRATPTRCRQLAGLLYLVCARTKKATKGNHKDTMFTTSGCEYTNCRIMWAIVMEPGKLKLSLFAIRFYGRMRLSRKLGTLDGSWYFLQPSSIPEFHYRYSPALKRDKLHLDFSSSNADINSLFLGL